MPATWFDRPVPAQSDSPVGLSGSAAQRWHKPMSLAYIAARMSHDPSTQNGAVLLGWNGDVICMGENRFPLGTPSSYWHDSELKYQHVVHAEMHAILKASFINENLFGATLVSPWAACSNCAKHIAMTGISRLVRHPHLDPDTNEAQARWHEDILAGDEIMLRAGVEILEIDPIYDGHAGQFLRGGELWP